MSAEHLFSETARSTLLLFKPRYFLLLLATVSLLGPGESSQAEVTLDGTMGPSGALAGPDVVIPDTVGQTQGTNLFHSFGVFNINTGESATFTGPAVIDNVLSRVTGGSQSFIDGLLRSTIESANLWFINPAGVLFGEHASLDVNGSFHVSTADYLRLADGGRFEATNPENSVLTVAPPEAFGFLGENPGGIAVQGSTLEVPSGETLSTVGGDIQIVGGNLTAPGGWINMASVASAGEVVLRDADLGVEPFERFGKIDISQNGLVSTSGEGGGAIFIRGGEFVMDNSFVQADTRGDQEGIGIDVQVDSLSLIGGAQIGANTFESGQGGNLEINAQHLEVRDGSLIATTTHHPNNGGDAGNVKINAGTLAASGGGAIIADTFGHGRGGNVAVTAKDVILEGTYEDLEGVQSSQLSVSIQGTEPGSGDGGDLFLNTNTLQVLNGAKINANTKGAGKGGNLDITANTVTLKGRGGGVLSGIAANANKGSTGDAGDIKLTATNTLKVLDGALIGSPALGLGKGGNVRIDAQDVLVDGFAIDENGFAIPSSITASSGDISEKGGGEIVLNTGKLEVRNSGQISVFTSGPGKGGNLQVTTDEILLQGPTRTLFTQTGLSAESFGTGESGSISIKTLSNLRLVNDGQISVKTTQADAGDIDINVGTLLHLRDGGSITTSVAGGTGDGGNITIDPVFTVLGGSSEIVAQAREGRGGNIRIASDFFFKSPDSLVSAASGNPELSGTVEIDSPDTDITGGITTLPESLFDAATLLRERCGVRAVSGQSSFIIGRGGIPPEPNMYLSASYFDVHESNQAQPVSGTENRAGFGLDLPMMTGGSLSGSVGLWKWVRISSAALTQARRVADKET